ASFYVWDALFPRKASGEDFLRYYFQTFSFRWLRLDPRAVLAHLPRHVGRDEVGVVASAVMQAQAEAYGKPRWGDKTPSHAGILDRIFADFPDARVVRIVRDPRAVVRSFARMPWAPASLVAGSGLCELERHQVSKHTDRLLQIRMEDLLDDPRATMAAVLDFVGEPWDDAVLAHHEHLPEPDDLPPVPWFASARKAPSRLRPPDWSGWDPVDLRLVEYLNRHTLDAFGYARAPLAEEPSRWAVFSRWLSDLPAVGRSMKVTLQAARLSRDAAFFDSQLSKDLFAQVNPAAWSLYPGFEMPDPPDLPAGWDDDLGVARLAS
ncbi:MAG: sulfotransferase, partial [Caldilineaceae bacterium]|nr:sulfotransferase [Caldilineaceae bacterium]